MINAGGTEAGGAFVFRAEPSTGDLRRVEPARGESDQATLARAIAAARPGDFVAVFTRGVLSRVWTAPADS
jgi:hypothetical protein